MSILLQELIDKKLVKPPDWLASNTHYLTVMGSNAYGVSSDNSDWDVYGFAIPQKEVIFPHLTGHIRGFDLEEAPNFEQWQKHHIFDPSADKGKGKEYDFTIFNIVKYFKLLTENNPNMLDSIFTRREHVLHCTQVANMVRESRRIFLHKGCFPKFKGYALSQLHKMDTKEPVGKRKEQRDKFGFDVKFAYHLVRLLNECEQILTTGDLDLMLNNEHLKAIRRGDITEKDIRSWAAEKELQLEKLCAESKLPEKPDMVKIKQLLVNCLEQHYGNLESCVRVPDAHENALREIKKVLDKAGI